MRKNYLNYNKIYKRYNTIKNITIQQLHLLLKEENSPPPLLSSSLSSSLSQNNSKLYFIDVRENEEIKEYCLSYSSLFQQFINNRKNISLIYLPLSDFLTWEKKIQTYQLIQPNDSVICMCRGGVRSLKFAALLKQNDYKEVYNLQEGLYSYGMNIDPEIFNKNLK